MSRRIALTARGLRLTGQPSAGVVPPPPPPPPPTGDRLLVTETGAVLVTESGDPISWGS